MMKIRFLGAAETVTGSSYYLKCGDVGFLVDCGMFQGSKQIKERNYGPLPVDPTKLDFMVLTHAHIDHIGLIPKYYAQGFRGKIYCTQATAKLASILLPDSAHIQEMEVERKNRKLSRAGLPLLTPIYTLADAENSLNLFNPLSYEETYDLAPGVRVRLKDAGHILGSACLEIWLTEGEETVKLVFSGDLGSVNQPVVRDPEAIDGGDYVIMESTYGSRLRQQNRNRRDELLEIINFTMNKGGNLIIPAFAVERTQDLLYDMSVLLAEGKLSPAINIYIDSPLAVAATKIFEESPEYYDQETRDLIAKGTYPFRLPNLRFSITQEDSVKLNQLSGGNIIISASGMCDAGRIKHHLKHNLWRPEATILFVGYQAQGTLGRRLLNGEKSVKIHGEQVMVRADIRKIEGYSAHADQAGLLSWVRSLKTKPHYFVLVHGEIDSLNALADLIAKETGSEVIIPKWMQELDLKPGEKTTWPAAEGFDAESRAVATKRLLELQAENTYLRLQAALNQLYSESLKSGDVGWFITRAEAILEQIEKK